MVDEAPTTAADAPEVVAVVGVLRQLWPELGEFAARRHATTLVRVLSKYQGPADPVAAGRLAVLARPAAVQGPAALDPETRVEVRGGLLLAPWTPEDDRRPRSKLPRWADPEWQPGGHFYVAANRNGRLYLGSARHGECTPCVKDGRLREAIYRLTDERGSWSRSSLCQPCASKMIGGPMVVPTFDTPEQAQAWLDAQDV